MASYHRYIMATEHTEYADRIGADRLEDAKNNSRDGVGHKIGDDKLTSYCRGTRCELAFYLWLGGKNRGVRWFSFKPNATANDLSMPDIVSNDIGIDVKTRPSNWNDFAVRKQSLNNKHAYILASDNFYPEVRFYGFLWGSQIRTFPIGGRPEIPCYVVSFDAILRDCSELMPSGSCRPFPCVEITDSQRATARRAIAERKQFEFISGQWL